MMNISLTPPLESYIKSKVDYSVRYTENARQDLEEIFSYIAYDNLENALSFLDELKERFDNTLSVFPNGGAFHNKAKGATNSSSTSQ